MLTGTTYLPNLFKRCIYTPNQSVLVGVVSLVCVSDSSRLCFVIEKDPPRGMLAYDLQGMNVCFALLLQEGADYWLELVFWDYPNVQTCPLDRQLIIILIAMHM